jgi:RHS repeat-associated protein
MVRQQVTFSRISALVRSAALFLACSLQLVMVTFAQGQICLGGCDDGNPCTLDECSDGVCIHMPMPAGWPCDSDGNPCTWDVCDGNGACTHESTPRNGVPCEDDGNPCTEDVCFEGACAHLPMPAGWACTGDGNPCTWDVCDGNGACTHESTPQNGLPCDDGNPCTVGDACSNGACAGTPKDCRSQNPCERGFCAGTGDCQTESICSGDKNLGEPRDPNTSQNEPVNVANGNMYMIKMDMSTPSVGMRFEFVRTYNSQKQSDSPLGIGWTHNFDVQLIPPADITSPSITMGLDGRILRSLQINPGFFQPPPGEYYTLISTGSGYLWEKKGGTKYAFDSQGLLLSIQDRNGNTITLSRDSQGRLTSIIDTAGRNYQLDYDPKGHITRISDTAGRIVNYQYDGSSNLIQVTDAAGVATEYQYADPNDPHNITRQNVGGQFVYTYRYDAQDRCIEAAGPGGEFENLFEYFPDEGRTVITDARGQILTKYYNSYGKVTKIAYPDGSEENVTWDASLNRTGEINQAGSTWQYEYDARGNLTKVTDPLNHQKLMTYDVKDNLTSLSDELGNTNTFIYDANGNLTRTNYADGTHIAFTYNSHGQPQGLTDAAGKVSVISYDPQGNLASVTNPEGDTVTYANDSLGRKISATDARGKTTAFQYDALSRILKVTDALGGQVDTTHVYSGLSSLKDQNNNTTTFQFNTLSQLTGVTDPTGHGNLLTFDLNGNLVSRKDYNGNTTTYTFNNMNRLTTVHYPDNSQVTYAYDLVGRLVQTVDGTGASSYAYDALGRLKAYTNGYSLTVAYTYDAAGNLVALTYPGNKTVTYGYDNRNRLIQVTDWAGRQTTYAYDPRGLPTRVNLPNGTAAEYDYDDAGRVIALSNLKGVQNIVSYTYLLDQNGNIIEETSDPVFNPDLQPRVSSFAYGTDNRLLTVDGASVTYDLNGNMLTKGNITYQYDYENRLKALAGPDVIWEFTYDENGDRISAKHTDIERRFLLNAKGMTNVLAEFDVNNNPVSYYIYGLGLLYKIDAAGNPYYYHFNSTGHTVAMTDSAGAVVNRYAYTPFGELASRSETISNPFRFVGKIGVIDDENGLFYMRARYYDPQIGCFISKDPVGFLGGINAYSYVTTNPINMIDPSGYCNFSTQFFTELNPFNINSTFSRTAISIGESLAGISIMMFGLSGFGSGEEMILGAYENSLYGLTANAPAWAKLSTRAAIATSGIAVSIAAADISYNVMKVMIKNGAFEILDDSGQATRARRDIEFALKKGQELNRWLTYGPK